MHSSTIARVSSAENLLANLGRRMRAAAPPLFWTGVGMLALSLPTLLLAALDDRTLQGVSVWLKPWKFQFSLAVFLLTLALFMVWLPGATLRTRAVRFVVWGAVLSGSFELIYITWQGALGLASHFNFTSSAAITMYQLMGLGAVTLSSTALVLGLVIACTKDYAVPSAVKLSIVLGLLLTFLLGTGFGAYLSAQQSGHWVGGIRSDAAGMPVVKWSRSGGDLRVAHFFGIHAMHFIPAFGLALHGLRIPSMQSRSAIWIFAVLYAVFSSLTFWQALRGHPFSVF